MLYCGDTKLTVSENWNSSDAEELGITHVTEQPICVGYPCLMERRQSHRQEQ